MFTAALDPIACNQGTDSFQNVYQWLLKRTNNGKYNNLLNFFRLIRNTIHNNGVYVDINNQKQMIYHKGKTYNFEHAKPVKNDDLYKLLFTEIPTDLISMIEETINSNAVSQVPLIKDPMPPYGLILPLKSFI